MLCSIRMEELHGPRKVYLALSGSFSYIFLVLLFEIKKYHLVIDVKVYASILSDVEVKPYYAEQ